MAEILNIYGHYYLLYFWRQIQKRHTGGGGGGGGGRDIRRWRPYSVTRRTVSSWRRSLPAGWHVAIKRGACEAGNDGTSLPWITDGAEALSEGEILTLSHTIAVQDCQLNYSKWVNKILMYKYLLYLSLIFFYYIFSQYFEIFISRKVRGGGGREGSRSRPGPPRKPQRNFGSLSEFLSWPNITPTRPSTARVGPLLSSPQSPSWLFLASLSLSTPPSHPGTGYCYYSCPALFSPFPTSKLLNTHTHTEFFGFLEGEGQRHPIPFFFLFWFLCIR